MPSQWFEQRARVETPAPGTELVKRLVGADVPMVGRDGELAVLQQALADVVERRQAHVVNVIGEAGVGKSRLLDELSLWIAHQPDRPLVLRGRSAPEGRSVPRRALRSLLTHRFEIRDDDTTVDVAARLGSGLSSLTSGQAEIVGHWIGFDFADSGAVRDLAGNREFGTIALGHLTAHLQWLLTSAPVVLLLDDLQWSDPESLDVIGHMVDAFPNAPMLVVCAARPSLFEHRPRWSAGPGDATITVDLAPLDDGYRRSHARHLLHRAGVIPAELVELVIDHARGNPFHAEQLIGLAVDHGVIVTDRQPWDVDLRLGFTPPTSLTGVIRARLDALSPEEANVLRHASVIGSTFWDDTLVAAATATRTGPSTHAEIAASLSKLHQRDLVQPHQWSVFTGCREYAFGHGLLRDAADETMPAAERPPVHHAAARWLERHTGGRIGEYLGLLAEHLSQAGELDRAADLLHEAGARAGDTSALQSALGFYQRSLTCREATATGHDVAATATRIELAHLLGSLGQNDEAAALRQNAEAAATYGIAESDATRSGSHRLAAHAMAGALRTAAARGGWDEAELLVERVRPLAERYGGEILGRFLSGHALLLIDGPHQDLRTAQQLTARALEVWRTLEDPASELRALNEMALVSAKAGRPSEADRWYEEGLALAHRVGDTSGEWMLLQNRAVLAHLEARAGRTDYARVLELYRSSLDRRRRLGLPHILSLANLAQAQVEAGHLEDGGRNAREALRIGWSRHDPLDWTIALITLAQVALAAGQLDDGLVTLGAVLAQRRTPSLEREIDAVLDFHGVDRSAAMRRMAEAASTDLATIVDQLLRVEPEHRNR